MNRVGLYFFSLRIGIVITSEHKKDPKRASKKHEARLIPIWRKREYAVAINFKEWF